MNLDKAEQLAITEISKHISGWEFSWNNRKKSFGLCRYRHKHIQLSRILTSAGDEQRVLETILHEIAHVIAYEQHGKRGHCRVWKGVCISIGGTGERTTFLSKKEDDIIVPSWVMVFGSDIVRSYTRKPNRKTFYQLKDMYLQNLPKHLTLGKLQILEYVQYQKMYA